jgi:tRNA-binding protein
MIKSPISFSDFERVDMCVGTIVDAQVFEKARNPAYKVWIDFGEDIGVKKSSAQITLNYDIKYLIGKQVIAVINFAPKQIADFMSECLILGSIGLDPKDITLLTPSKAVTNGLKIG